MVKMCRPNTISHMAMKMLRLLKKRSESVSGDTDDLAVGDGSSARKA